MHVVLFKPHPILEVDIIISVLQTRTPKLREEGKELARGQKHVHGRSRAGTQVGLTQKSPGSQPLCSNDYPLP